MPGYFYPRRGWSDWHILKELDHRRGARIFGKQKRPRGIAGPVLCGFYAYFEEGWGDPNEESPLPIIVPSFIGNSLLPFRCPRCKRPAQELACPETREKYHDRREGRDNYYCPCCGYRFKIDLQGTPLTGTVRPGALVGPSLVKRGNEVCWQDKSKFEGDYVALANFSHR